MDVPKNLKDEIWDYCRANDITDVDGFMVKLIQTAFTIEKYGYSPSGGEPMKPIEKEVVKEVIKEVPIEKIIEKIVEIPVEKVVEKIVTITDDIEVNKLIREKQVLEDNRVSEIEKYNEQLFDLSKERDELNNRVKELNKTIAEKDEQIDKISKSKKDDEDIYGERTTGRLGSNLLD